MSQNKNIYQFDENGYPHGYWELYWSNGNIRSKGYYINDKRYGYWEYYYYNGQLMYKGNFVNDNRHGYWKVYYNNGEIPSQKYYL